MQNPKKVAVVGSGCAGIGALWALKSTAHEVHLYEASGRLGGHTNTVTWKHGGHEVPVDTGFIVLNTATYPNFISFLKDIEVSSVPTSMDFGVSRDQGLFEWSGTSLSAVFAQKSNLFSAHMWRLLFDFVRFNQFALDLLSEDEESEVDPAGSDGPGTNAQNPRQQQSIGEYLAEHNYSDAFKDDYLIPMTAAVWSTTPDKVSLEFPAITLVRFMWNHHLLSTFAARPTWMTIPGGSQQYIDKVMSDFPKARTHLATKVDTATPLADGRVKLRFQSNFEETFDHVILTTHGDEALEIVRKGATPEEIDVLSGFKFSTNTAVLHSDLRLMPTRPLAWAAWNYITKTPTSSSHVSSVCLTYWMNLLQHIPSSKFGQVLVTLNPNVEPDPAHVQGTWTYTHPLYNPAAIRSQKLLPKIQNKRGISYAGAWTKYGFHEDGFSSGIRVAMEHLGAVIPFEFTDSTFSRGRKPKLGWPDYATRMFVWIVQAIVWVMRLFIGVLPRTSLGQIRTKKDH
ncbi:MAG: hypothetical protein Q9191_001250 [Dirinaria sp. TL-2023a]